jgi:predicted alpha-1,6-mannanase (GH76 family)
MSDDTKLTQKEAAQKVAQYIAEAESALSKAEDIATEYGVGFSWDGPSRGMGGYFNGARLKEIEDRKTQQPNDDDDEWSSSSDDGGWSSSSPRC